MYTKWSGGGVSCSLMGDEINSPTASLGRLQKEQCGFEADRLLNMTLILRLLVCSDGPDETGPWTQRAGLWTVPDLSGAENTSSEYGPEFGNRPGLREGGRKSQRHE
jgi:hypothetical protein